MSGATSKRITVVGASTAGCAFALLAAAEGHAVTLIDEHPQTMAQMAFDAPYFYGSALPAALANSNAMAQAVAEANSQIFACVEAGVDVRMGTVVWGAFQKGPNCLHIGTPKVGLVSVGGNALLEHDVLVLATGVRDFVPSFQGAELPGVFGVKAGVAFLDQYQCYEGKRTLVLGTSLRAVDFVKRAMARGVSIAGMVEPGQHFAAGKAAAAEIAGLGVPVFLEHVILAAEGAITVERARLLTAASGVEQVLACDSICAAIGVLPNIELAAAMGCRLTFDAGAGAWLPAADSAGRTSREGVLWLSGFSTVDETAALNGLEKPAPLSEDTDVLPRAMSQGPYLREWVKALLAADSNVALCKCEAVSRSAFLGLAPPSYLQGTLRHPQSPITHTGAEPRIQQDFMKRMTRVGMGHCQGRRCRDEASLLLSIQFGVELKAIVPGSYRFPVRPIDLSVIACEDDTYDTRERWSYWLHEPDVPAQSAPTSAKAEQDV